MNRIDIPDDLLARVPQAADDFLEAATTEVAAQGMANVHRILDARIKNPTPYYETQIRTDRQVNDVVVHDSGVIYGPWLEGTSSRNQTTRFKGYRAFRLAAQELRLQVPGLIGPIARAHLGSL